MIFLNKLDLLLQFSLLLLELLQLTLFHLLQILCEELSLWLHTCQLGLRVREDDPLARSLSQLLQDKHLEGLAVLKVFILLVTV
jgi:hypothetical protein